MPNYYPNISSLNVHVEEKVSTNPDKSGTNEFSLIRLTLADAQSKATELLNQGYSVSYSPQNGFYLLNVSIGTPSSGSAAPEPEWSISPSMTEKSILETAIPIVSGLSTETKERVQAALNNPGKFYAPSRDTGSLENAFKVLHLMQMGIETMPYFTLDLSRTVYVPRYYVSQWTFDPLYVSDDRRNVYSLASFVSTFAVPAYVSALLPASATQNIGNGLSAFWGYMETGRSLKSAPDNQWVIEQKWTYDKWITDMVTVVSS